MPLFQSSVITKHLQSQNKENISTKWETFKNHFHNPTVQEEIKSLKEEQYQGEFLEDLFVKILGYTKPASSSETKFNITTEYKNVKDSKKADGAILVNNGACAIVKGVLELKGTNTTDLGKIEVQAFGYKNNQPNCTYVITSNFEKLRFYIDNAIEHIEFNLFTLTEKEFSLLYLCLAYENIEKDIPKKIKDQSISQEDAITKKLYNDYSLFKRELHQNLVLLNPQYDALELFKKSQKLLDRFLFLFFSEDRQLLPPNSVRLILDQWKTLQELDEVIPLYNRFKKYFEYLNTGFKGKKYDVFAYNGGLFKPDEILDTIKIDDELLYKHALNLSQYDFDSEVDVNILGHIFENSLNELDEIKAQLAGEIIDKTKSKRKKDGVFYTPKYITKYIVENTVGKLCEEKRPQAPKGGISPKLPKKEKQQYFEELKDYRNWLLQLSICDPACGSGAFLNQALDFLINEHKYIDELQAKLFGDAMVLSDVEKSILENNLFGVDLNEESVEIAKLSLWLRTAQPNRKLNDLNNNIKCGNSLIDDPEIAGEKAFNWHQEFPQIFKEKNKKAWHITTAIHDSRTSQRMLDYKVREKRAMGTMPEPQIIPLSEEEETLIVTIVAEIVIEDKLSVMAFNVCKDHIHLVLVCDEDDLQKNVQKIKAKTARAVNIHRGVTIPASTSTSTSTTMEHAPLSIDKEKNRGEKQNSLWTQKFGCKEIIDDQQLSNTIEYVKNNRVKHELPLLPILQQWSMLHCLYQSYDDAFREEYKGGFDVVIGNPPYVNLERMKDVSSAIEKMGYETYNKRGDLYILFVEKGFNLLKKEGIISYIMPNKWLQAGYGKNLREYFLNKELIKLIDFGDLQIFEGATTYPCIFVAKSSEPKTNFSVSVLNSTSSFDFNSIVSNTSENFKTNQFSGDTWVISSKDEKRLLNNLSHLTTLSEFISGNVNRGIIPGLSEAFIIDNDKKAELIKQDKNSENIIGSILRGRDLSRYGRPNQTDLDSIILAGFGSYKFIKNEYPAIYNHLIKYEEKLKKRGQCNGSKETNDKPFTGQHHWLELDNTPLPAYLNLFSKPKIMYQVFQVKPCFIFDENELYCNNSMWIIPTDNKALLGILNSKMGWWLINKFCTQIQNGCQLIWKYFGQIPIPEISNENLTISVDNILSLNKELQEFTQKFQRTLQRKFELEVLPKKLQEYYQLTYAEFIKELAKKKVKLSLSQEAEWEDYFLQEQQKAVALKTKIDTTDKEIDVMVYELYGLTEEEIKIVENS